MRFSIIDSLMVILSLVVLPFSTALGSDGWNFSTETDHSSLYYWEFKYFNFDDPVSHLRGNISFFTVSPKWFNLMGVSVHLYKAGHLYSFQKTFPLSCIKAAADTPELQICKDQGGIRVGNNGETQISLSTEQLSFSLLYHPKVTNTEIFNCPLDGKLFGTRAWMKWRPLFLDASVSGKILLRKKGSPPITFEIETSHAYHDQNWGIWKPSKHPYRWMHFTGKDSYGSDIQILLGDFYKTQSENVLKTVLIIEKNGQKKIYMNSEVEIREAQYGPVPVTRFGAFDRDTLKEGTLGTLKGSTGSHEVPLRFSVKTKDNKINFEAVTEINDSTGAKFLIKLLMGDFYINEQIVKVSGFSGSDGLRLPFEGYGEVQFVGR